MIVAEGILTSRGGKTSHAAVVARGMGKTCVCGTSSLVVDTEGKHFTTPDGRVFGEGALISIDGTSGEVFLGEVPVVSSPVVRYFEGEIDPTAADADELVKAVHQMMNSADNCRRMSVRANADTPEDAARARRFGAQGIGLCRTEHMFLGDRREMVEALILADSDADRDDALAELLPLQRDDFVGFMSRTRCSDCAGCVSAWWFPVCSPCKRERCLRRRCCGSRPAATRGPRSWCRWSERCRSWSTSRR
jgi:pyruvate,orthophosphate dikinase